MYGLTRTTQGLGSIWDEIRELAQAGAEAAARTLDLEVRRRLAEWGVSAYDQLPPDVRAEIERKVASTKARELAGAGWPWMIAAGIVGAVIFSGLFQRRRR